jgi:hypothetical protein
MLRERETEFSVVIILDSTDRKRVNDRIQGFGNSASARQLLLEDVASPQTPREKIRSYRENRTKKMDIGQTSWKAKVEEFVVDILSTKRFRWNL